MTERHTPDDDPTTEPPARDQVPRPGEGVADPGSDDDPERELPDDVVDEAERLTRAARETGAEAERVAHRERRAELLGDYGFTARVRADDDGDVLVLHPAEWVDDGSVAPDRIDDLGRAIEVPLSGPGDPEEWAAVDEHNREIAATVREEHGDVHGDNAAAFADFMGNHYSKPVERATGEEVREFVDEYFPRNAWPSDDQKAVVGRSIELVFQVAGEDVPEL